MIPPILCPDPLELVEFRGLQRIEQLFFCNIGLIEDADQAKNNREGIGTNSFGSLLESKDLGGR